MIRKIKFSNFYSFNETQEISFLTNKKKSYDYYNSKKDGEQITKVAGFVGGNASGKTNIMRLFSFLNYFVCESSRNYEEGSSFKTFFDNNKKSDFYIEFEVGNFIYNYNFSIKNNIITNEALSQKGVEKGSHVKDIFARNGNSVNILNKKYFGNFPKGGFENMRKDVSLIAYTKASFDVDVINIIYDYFLKFNININETGELSDDNHKIVSINMYLGDNNLKLEMEEFIRRFDIGLKEVDIQKKVDGNKVGYSVFGVHSVESKEERLSFLYESRGTVSLFHMLAYILTALKNNSVVIIDEIETGLHPEAVSKIINYFIDENENGNAQLIFSSHSLDFMKKFDMNQIFLVDKDEKLNSFAYRLDDVDGVRSDENFLSKYMSGAYGAFPDIKV